MSFCSDCFKGFTHEGTPKGKWEQIGGIDCYIGTPSDMEYPKDKVLLYLSDVYGIQFVNSQLLVDDFAANGIWTIGVDLFFGDALPADAMRPESTFDVDAWRQQHPYERTRPAVDRVIAALKERGITTFGATAYCFGAPYVRDLAIENTIKVAAMTHPSRLKVPEDMENYLAHSQAPLLINSCEFDAAFPAEACSTTDALLGNGKFTPGYKREYFPGCRHGFMSRGDPSDPKVKEGKEGAFKATVEWMTARL